MNADELVDSRQLVKTVDALDFFTGFQALAAEDTLRIIAHDGGIFWIDRHTPLELSRQSSGAAVLIGQPAGAAGIADRCAAGHGYSSTGDAGTGHQRQEFASGKMGGCCHMKNSFPKKQLGSEQVYFRLSHTQIGQKNAGFCRMD